MGELTQRYPVEQHVSRVRFGQSSGDRGEQRLARAGPAHDEHRQRQEPRGNAERVYRLEGTP